MFTHKMQFEFTYESKRKYSKIKLTKDFKHILFCSIFCDQSMLKTNFTCSCMKFLIVQ